MKTKKTSYIVWKNYQRRAEVLASLLDARLEFMPHIFERKCLRLLDYFLKLIATLTNVLQHQPDLIIFQAPPLFAAIPALLLGVTYVIDAHNVVFQGIWYKLPLSKFIIKQAGAVIVHNFEILKIATTLFPETQFVSIQDPIQYISKPGSKRLENQILVVCSFASDEPVDIIIDSISKLPHYKFVITADINKLQLSQRQRLCKCKNIDLTGFLPTEEYHTLLCTSSAVLVLTTREATQPSGACEALSSDTQLIVSNSTLTQEMFGGWAILVDNTVESIVAAVQALNFQDIDLSSYRDKWNTSVRQAVMTLHTLVDLS